VDGKTVSETFATEVRRAQREVEAFHRFRELSSQLLKLNEQICRLRAVEETLTPQKKTAQAVQQEVTGEVEQVLSAIFGERRKTGRRDWEAIERAVRSTRHQAGAAAWTELLQFEAPAADQRSLPWGCGQQAQYQEVRSQPILTAVGPARVSRPDYLCLPRRPVSGRSRTGYPEHGVLSRSAPQAAYPRPGCSFRSRAAQMKLPANLEVTTQAVERIAEAMGEDIAAREQEEIDRPCSWTCRWWWANRFRFSTCS
jgi:hypothetical protein